MVSQAAHLLRAMRMRAGFGLREFARLVGMKTTSYQHYETRYKKRELPFDLFLKAKPLFLQRGIQQLEIEALCPSASLIDGGKPEARLLKIKELLELELLTTEEAAAKRKDILDTI